MALITACGDRQSGSREPAYGDSDSASIGITADSAPTWTAADRWLIDPAPTLDIGVLDKDPMYEFAIAKRPVRLSDGRIAVINMKTTEIRYFSPDGKFLKTIGREGRGPGELEQMWDMRKIVGDSLMAVNPPNELSIFAPNGDYVRRFTLERGPPGYSNIWMLGHLESGYIVAVALARFGTRNLSAEELKGTGEVEANTRPTRPVGYRDTLMHFLYSMEGRLLDSVAALPGQFLDRGEYPPEAAYAVDGDRFYHTPGEKIEIREYTLSLDSASTTVLRPAKERRTPSMRLTRIIRLPSPANRAVTQAHKELILGPVRERARKAGRSSEADINMRLERTYLFPDSLPAHGRSMRIDPDHNIWVKNFDPNPDAPPRWFVVDPRGKWLGTVETPGRFEVNEIGSDYVLGLWRDAFDMQHVRMYRIRKGGGSK